MEYSISPEGEKFKIPDEQDYKKEYLRLEKLAKAHPQRRAGDCGGHGSRIRGRGDGAA